jgi:hypothetical protein
LQPCEPAVLKILQSLPSKRVSTLVACCVGCLCAAACSGMGPTTPSGADRLPLRPGTYSLVMTGADLSNDPALPVCDPVGVPYDGKSVSATVRLARDVNGWTVRSSAPDVNDLEVQFHQSGEPAFPRLDFPVTGRIHGSSWDMSLPFKPAYDVRVLLAGIAGDREATFQGVVERSGLFGWGTIGGDIIFTDHGGAASRCTAIGWYLTPVA